MNTIAMLLSPASRILRGAMFALCMLVAPFALGQQAWETGTDGLAPIPALHARVTDLTHTLSGTDTAALEGKLADWEQRTGNQLVVLMVPSTKPEPIEGYSLRVAEAWKIGRKGQDNGALFVIAKDDRKLRIEVGYGLEGSLTDVTAKRIIADDVAPQFRQGQFAAGVNAGVDRIISVVDKGEPLAAKPAPKAKRGVGFSFETILILLFVVVPILGRVLSSVFGKLLGSTVGAGVVGAAAWFLGGSIIIAIVAGVIGLIVMLVFGLGAGGFGRRGGVWMPTGGIGGGGFGGGGGGGFSGGGGGFGGGGASGGW